MFYNTPDFRDVVDAFIKGAPLADIPFVLVHLPTRNPGASRSTVEG